MDRVLFGYSLYASFFLAPPSGSPALRWNNPIAWLVRRGVTPALVFFGVLVLGVPAANFFGWSVPDPFNVANYVLVVPAYWAIAFAFYSQVEWCSSQLIENGYVTEKEIEETRRKYRLCLSQPLLPALVFLLCILVQWTYFETELSQGHFEKWRTSLAEPSPSVRRPLHLTDASRLQANRHAYTQQAAVARERWARLVATEARWARIRQPSAVLLGYYLAIQGVSLFMLIMTGAHAIAYGFLFRDLFNDPPGRSPLIHHRDTRWGLSGHGRLATILGLLCGDLFLNLVTWRLNLDQSETEWFTAAFAYTLGPAIIVLYMLPTHRYMTWHKDRLLAEVRLDAAQREHPFGEEQRMAAADHRIVSRLASWPISVRGVIGLILFYLQFLVTTYARIRLLSP